MTIKKILEIQKKQVMPEKKVFLRLKKIANSFVKNLSSELSRERIGAQVFIGGSFAKGTLVKKEKYDIDIFVRFDWRFENISDLLEKPLKRITEKEKLRIERIHGSRDYFRVYFNENAYFEVIPVTRIKKPQEERNVTDLSYFHVSYIKKKIKGLEDEVRLTKTFMESNKVYGAETYVRGFSGYSIECLIIYYKSFLRMLRELSKIKIGERKVIDIEKKYKNKRDVFFELNENKLHSPVILIDPTYKERNTLAALSQETFEKFQKTAKEFLKKPTDDFFKERKIDPELLKKEAKRKKAEFLHLRIETDKQPGDIAGTKLKKFAEFLKKEFERYFKAIDFEFAYDEERKADVYLILKSKKQIVRIGPPLRMKKHVSRFKKEHLDTYEKNGFIHAKVKINFGAKEYLDAWEKGNKKVMDEMGTVGIEIL